MRISKNFYTYTHTRGLTLLALLCFGCGSSKQSTQPDAPVGGAIGGGEYGCKSRSACPAIEMDKTALGSFEVATNSYLGTVNVPVNWEITGNDLSGAGRNVGILIFKRPQNSTVSPDPVNGVQNSAKIIWTPTASGQSSTNMVIVMRDLDRCRMFESAPSRCNEAVVIARYDKTSEIGWRVQSADAIADLNGAVVKVSNPNCGQAATTDSQITGQIAGKLIQVGIGAVTGGAAALPGLIMQGASGILNGATAGQQQTDC